MTFRSLQFSVTGSTGNHYEVNAFREGNRFIMTCNCEAGIRRTYCKHRIALLDGDCSALRSENADDVDHLRALLHGTEAERYYHVLVELDSQMRELTKKIKDTKRAFARSINRADT
jgi:hypothetical protein